MTLSSIRKTLTTTLFILLTLAAITPPIKGFAKDKFKIVTTFTVIADMARNVAGDAADVVSITKPDAEIHNYQPTPRDIIKASDSDLILWNGLNLELWFEKFFANLKDIPSVTISQGVKPISISAGPYNGKPNPHAWMSTGAAIIYVDNIANAFIKYDPNNAEIYKKNASDYKLKINKIGNEIKAHIQALPENNRWLVTSEGAFSYLARDLDLKEAYLWPINADQQGTPKQVRNIIDLVRANNIPAIFSESTVSADPAKQIARETDAHYGGLLYVDSLTDAAGKVPTYLDLLRITTTTIAEGLSR